MNRATRVRIKFCGITRPEDGLEAALAGADAVGLVFVKGSPRNVTTQVARAVVAALPPLVCRVGVFVNPHRDDVEAAIEAAGLHLLQFHGEESSAFCTGFAVPYCRAVRVSGYGDVELALGEHPRASAVLLDACVPDSHGGTGRTFPWEYAPANVDRPVILAGGLTVDNVGAAIAAVHPYAVDVSGGIESSPGVKDAALMRRFAAAVKKVSSQ